MAIYWDKAQTNGHITPRQKERCFKKPDGPKCPATIEAMDSINGLPVSQILKHHNGTLSRGSS